MALSSIAKQGLSPKNAPAKLLPGSFFVPSGWNTNQVEGGLSVAGLPVVVDFNLRGAEPVGDDGAAELQDG